MSAQQPRPGGDLVPIADRLAYMQAFRIAVVAAVALVAGWGSEPLASTSSLVLASAAYVTGSVATHLAWRVSRTGGLALFGGMLIVDGIYLAWTSYVTGGFESPIRYLVLVHLIAVALLASYRTGAKVALWHSILLLVLHYAAQAEALGVQATASFGELAGFSALMWFVAIATSSFSAVNERELRRRRYDLEALATMATRLEGAASPVDVGDALLDCIADTFGYERAVLATAPDGGALTVISHRGAVHVEHGAHMPSGDSVLHRATKTRTTQLVSTLDTVHDRWLAEILPEASNLVLLPLFAEGQSMGVLVVEHDLRGGSRIERRVVSMLERFASHGTLALRNAWLVDRLRRRASTDGLTGVANRRAFESALNTEIARASRGGDDLSLLLLDIDHFKLLNDTHGHQAGDDVLKTVAATLAVSVRPFDLVARYGGEEFAVLLPRTPAAEAMTAAERIREAVAQCSPDVPVTISGGVATFPLDAVDSAGVVRAADAALYASKRAGRDRITTARRGGEQERVVLPA